VVRLCPHPSLLDRAHNARYDPWPQACPEPLPGKVAAGGNERAYRSRLRWRVTTPNLGLPWPRKDACSAVSFGPLSMPTNQGICSRDGGHSPLRCYPILNRYTRFKVSLDVFSLSRITK
jgi:hypothetical protein